MPTDLTFFEKNKLVKHKQFGVKMIKNFGLTQCATAIYPLIIINANLKVSSFFS